MPEVEGSSSLLYVCHLSSLPFRILLDNMSDTRVFIIRRASSKSVEIVIYCHFNNDAAICIYNVCTVSFEIDVEPFFGELSD